MNLEHLEAIANIPVSRGLSLCVLAHCRFEFESTNTPEDEQLSMRLNDIWGVARALRLPSNIGLAVTHVVSRFSYSPPFYAVPGCQPLGVTFLRLFAQNPFLRNDMVQNQRVILGLSNGSHLESIPVDE